MSYAIGLGIGLGMGLGMGPGFVLVMDQKRFVYPVRQLGAIYVYKYCLIL